MVENKNDNLHTEELVLEIENVIKRGLNKILNNYVERYDLLEQTHKQIMMLPSVANELNQIQSQNNKNFTETKCVNYKDDNRKNMEFTNIINIQNITDVTKKLIKEEIGHVEAKLEIMEKNYETITPLLQSILNKVQSITDDVYLLKNGGCVEKPIEPITLTDVAVTSSVSENIKLEIEEESQEEEDESEEEESEEEESEEEESEEEEEVPVIEVPVIEVPVKEESEEEESVKEESEEEESDEEEEPLKEETVGQEVNEEDEIETEASESDEEQEEEVADEKEEEEEEELFEIEIDDITYCTNNEENGFIYELTKDGDVGEKVGYLKEGEPFFYADEK